MGSGAVSPWRTRMRSTGMVQHLGGDLRQARLLPLALIARAADHLDEAGRSISMRAPSKGPRPDGSTSAARPRPAPDRPVHRRQRLVPAERRPAPVSNTAGKSPLSKMVGRFTLSVPTCHGISSGRIRLRRRNFRGIEPELGGKQVDDPLAREIRLEHARARARVPRRRLVAQRRRRVRAIVAQPIRSGKRGRGVRRDDVAMGADVGAEVGHQLHIERGDAAVLGVGRGGHLEGRIRASG